MSIPRTGAAGFWLWLVGGAALGFGVASLPSIGMFVLLGAVVILAAAGIVTRGAGWPLVLAGAALPLLWVAWLHRRGPGWVTYETDTGGGGSELLDPVPWLVAGLGLLALSGVLLAVGRWVGRWRGRSSTR
ncbi:hypothetical protein [Ornithinimicrobium tianjinense]|uniref:Uncharacterized protein n=1 Tax=Ornithinimicrobium tianjinense TaxID=1195761 RepID=A0A917BV78_9MICO|nr:hypothetical protein [Ornithinimicrobium tianjinense]GGF58033.1 hypothetical protein GCM10011366_27280 [Ornithinimicrobium tianjinense]